MTIKLFEANESCYIELNFSSIELQKYKIRFIAAGLSRRGAGGPSIAFASISEFRVSIRIGR